MDEHVHAAVTEGLRARGVDVLTVQEDGMSNRPDGELLERAKALGRVLFSQDSDLTREAARRQREAIPFAGVIYVHPLAITIGPCIQDLELLAKVLEPEEFANRLEYLPLR
jgi:predicted nuclease of predicted toxin-antitoxin system